MVFTTEGFFEVAIESWPEWDLNLRPLNSVQLALRANFVQLLQFHRLFSVRFHFGHCLRQSPRLCIFVYITLYMCILHVYTRLCIHWYNFHT